MAMNKSFRMLTACAILGLTSSLVALDAFADLAERFSRENPAGGTTAGKIRNETGPEGGKFLQRRTIRTDGEGNAAAVTGGAFRTPEGAAGTRGGVTVRKDDGSIEHKSGAAVTGERGTLKSSGGVSVDAEGNVSGSRSTDIEGAKGGSFEGSTSYDKDSGLTRSQTCFDAGGNEVPCPSR
ncbi:hypothetical protein [Thiococcus pfennigii]|uniref:hypothetical protein n=1 Tax=Thiococcus pfennigii TaxID=1057 RepID=UPI001906DD5D|nr:hypothetical protein [Thiococcus pfennigii]